MSEHVIVTREGPQPIGRVIHLLTQICGSLAEAHGIGLIHRDIKPANIWLEAPTGRVKILDFGLAKLHGPSKSSDAATTAHQTDAGTVLGTVAYMSPEQAEGKPVDARSDVFSLGVMLYEMATGERPFKGDTSLSTLAAIMRDSPRPVTEVNGAVLRARLAGRQLDG